MSNMQMTKEFFSKIVKNLKGDMMYEHDGEFFVKYDAIKFDIGHKEIEFYYEDTLVHLMKMDSKIYKNGAIHIRGLEGRTKFDPT